MTPPKECRLFWKLFSEVNKEVALYTRQEKDDIEMVLFYTGAKDWRIP